MPITINGSGTVTGITAGGLPDGVITTDDIAAAAVTSAKLAAGAGGKILQVASTTKLDTFSSTSNSFVDVTGLSVSITPTSSSSKILVMCHISASGATWHGGFLMFNLLRASTNLSVGTGGSSSNATAVYNAYSNDATNTQGNISPISIVFLDSPSSTSSLTYKIQGAITNSGYSWNVNRTTFIASHGSSSSITVMEVAA
jgi:hypothetical protein